MRRVIFLIAVVLVCSSFVMAEDWPFLFGPDKNGISNEKGWLDETPSSDDVKVIWKKEIGDGCGSVVVSRGRVYTMSNLGTKAKPETHKDIVYCFDAVSGEEIWRHIYWCGFNFKSNTPGGPFATPTVDGGRVYTYSRKGDAYCFDAKTGEVKWYRDLANGEGMLTPFQGGFAGSPLVLGNNVIYNAGVAGVALNKKSGEVIWKSDPNIAAQATPVPFKIGRKQCVAMFGGEGLIGVEANSGKELWRYLWPTKYKTNSTNPVIIDDRIFISTAYDMGCVMLDISGGEPKEIWQNKEMQNHYSTSIFWNGYIYGFDKSQLKCMDIKNGERKWILKGGYGKGGQMMADGKLIVLTEKGVLLIGEARPDGFEPIIDKKIIGGKSYAPPVLANGRIYARNLTGDLVCVKLRD
ncbi:MAG: PQQ-binding-like beta-propeller repeat protein [Planctomycetota bacterium]